MIVQFSYDDGCRLQVIKTVAKALDCSLIAAKMFVDQGFVSHLTPEMAEKLSNTLAYNVYVKQVNTNNEDAESPLSEQPILPAIVEANPVDEEEIPASQIMIVSDMDRRLRKSVILVLCFIRITPELFEKTESDNRRLRAVCQFVNSIIPQVENVIVGTPNWDDQPHVLISLQAPDRAIDLDKITQLGEFAEAIGEAVIDSIDNRFNEERFYAIAKDLAPLYEE